ncbi:MAG: hypothetical protein GX442_17325 [Candidatus Riflebacteria bacterium]|nr:hypothetical protein [Candidatus Riflebacteria bacterium]
MNGPVPVTAPGDGDCQPAERRALLALCLLSWLLLHWVLPAWNPGVGTGLLADADCYHRMYRARLLLDGEGWFSDRLPRYNAPFGHTSYWTRPLDVLLLAGRALLQPLLPPDRHDAGSPSPLPPPAATCDAPFAQRQEADRREVGSTSWPPSTAAPTAGFVRRQGADRALFWAGALLSPFLHLLIIPAFWWAARPLLGERGRWWALLVLSWQFAIIPYLVLGRADQHGLIILALVLAVGFTLRQWRGDPDGPGAGTGLGLVGAAAFWISIECQVFLYLCFASLAAGWWFGEVEARAGPRRAGLWMAGGTALAVMAERLPADWFRPEFDRVSVVHVAVGLLMAAFFTALGRLGDRGVPAGVWRGGVLGGAAAACCLAMRAVFPLFFDGPYAGLEPHIRRFMDTFVDLLPLDLGTLDGFRTFLSMAGHSLVVIPLLAGFLWRPRAGVDRRKWLFVLVWATVVTWGTIRVNKLGYLAGLFLAIGAGPLFPWLAMTPAASPSGAGAGSLGNRLWAAGRGVGWGTLLVLGPFLAGLLLPSPPAASGPMRNVAVQFADLCRDLEDETVVGSAPAVIMTWMNFGTDLVFHTRHDAVGTPIHRNQEGLTDTFTVYGGPDEAAARAVLRRRGVRFLVANPDYPGMVLPGWAPFPETSLQRRLERGEVPGWLQPVPLVWAASGPFRLFRVLD